MTIVQPTAAILAIGDELLLGETENTNTTFFCRRLADRGIDVRQAMVIPDQLELIAGQVRDQAGMFDHLFVCGGIGPTPDDLTRFAVALAFGVELKLDQTAAAEYSRRKGKPLSEGQLEMCRLPVGSVLIWSEYPSPPAFRVQNCMVFPGVPAILESAWQQAQKQLTGVRLETVSFRTKYGESAWRNVMQDFIDRYPLLKIGSYPIMGDRWLVEVRIRGFDTGLLTSAAAEMEAAINTECGG